MTHSFYAHGKLLISGEYAVLKGARALATPTVKGQMLHFFADNKGRLKWRSFDHQDEVWFSATFSLSGNILQTSDPQAAEYLAQLLGEASRLAQKSIPSGEAATHLEFSRDWGLGSSSTLIHLVAQWFEVDPMKLFFGIHEGSGYDVACAGSPSALIYQKNGARGLSAPVELPESFRKVLFVHLNKKQRSLPEVKRFLRESQSQESLNSISDLCDAFLNTGSSEELAEVMDEHERLLSGLLKVPTVKERLFPDFTGSIKSLGAWGGDFIMAVGDDSSDYFKKNGYQTHRSFIEMVL